MQLALCRTGSKHMPSSTISFSFPGWDFAGKEERTTFAAPATHDWLEDLDELQGEEAQEGSTAEVAVVAAKAEGGANWLGCAEWPDDIAHAVLSHLDVRALSDARACCLHWKRIAQSDLLWERLWEANPRFCTRPARQPCGSVFRLPGAAQPTAFLRYLTRARARKLYEWVDLQKVALRLSHSCQQRLPLPLTLTLTLTLPVPVRVPIPVPVLRRAGRDSSCFSRPRPSRSHPLLAG